MAKMPETRLDIELNPSVPLTAAGGLTKLLFVAISA